MRREEGDLEVIIKGFFLFFSQFELLSLLVQLLDTGRLLEVSPEDESGG